MEISALAWNHDGAKIAVANSNIINIIDPINLQILQMLVGHQDYIFTVAWRPQHPNELASVSNDGSVRLWDTVTGKNLAVYQHSAPIFPPLDIDWQLDGKQLISVGMAGAVKVWDVDSNTLFHAVQFTVDCYWVGVHPKQQLFAFTTGQATVGLINIHDLSIEAVLYGHSGIVRNGGWHPNGEKLASAGWEEDERNIIKIWDMRTREEVTTLLGHTSTINALAWSPNGHYLASVSDDQTLQLWDSENWSSVLKLNYAGPILAVTWHPNSKQIAFGGEPDNLKNSPEIYLLPRFLDRAKQIV